MTGLRRILVPVDASPNSLAALEAAAEMAAAQQAELECLFVEDRDLFRLTEHGFASEVSLCTCSLRPMRRRDLELQLRARAERIRRELARAADRWGISWRFRVSRGTVHAEIREAASKADLTVLGKAGWSQRLSGQAGSTVHALISGPGGSTLILQQGGRIRPTLGTVYTGSDLSKRTLTAIPDLLRLEGFRIIVYIPEDTEKGFPVLRREAAALLPPETRADFRPLGRPHCAVLLRELTGEGAPETVILPCEAPSFRDEPLKELINGSSVPVLLIRPGAKRRDTAGKE